MRETIRPIFSPSYEPGADRIVFQVPPFFLNRFFGAEESVETAVLPLPIGSCRASAPLAAFVHFFAHPAFECGGEIAEVGIAIFGRCNDRMEMIGHDNGSQDFP